MHELEINGCRASPPLPSTVKTLLKLPNPLGTVLHSKGPILLRYLRRVCRLSSPGASTSGASQVLPVLQEGGIAVPGVKDTFDLPLLLRNQECSR